MNVQHKRLLTLLLESSAMTTKAVKTVLEINVVRTADAIDDDQLDELKDIIRDFLDLDELLDSVEIYHEDETVEIP